MNALPHNIDDWIKDALTGVEPLMQDAFSKVDGIPPKGSTLDQNGLADGGDVVLKFLDVGELGMALEHLIYMVHEPALPISQRTYACIEAAGRAMGMNEQLWEKIRPR